MVGQLLVLSGPSGVGKGTLCKRLLAAHPDWLWSVSATSRAPRVGETDGVEYWFLSPQAFEDTVAQGGFLEWATYNGNQYGTLREPVERALNQQKTVLLEIDVQGALQVKQAMPQARLIFVAPPSLQVLQARLEQRGTNDVEDIQRRVAIAQTELEQTHAFDAVVINESLEACAQAIEAHWAS
ncbi:MAG: guanylate kinase [Vampirovibrionales bacterium]